MKVCLNLGHDTITYAQVGAVFVGIHVHVILCMPNFRTTPCCLYSNDISQYQKGSVLP